MNTLQLCRWQSSGEVENVCSTSYQICPVHYVPTKLYISYDKKLAYFCLDTVGLYISCWLNTILVKWSGMQRPSGS